MEYDVVVVGGGIAGLTSSAYLAKEGLKVLLCEKEEKVGGLVNSFNYKGFTFDGGIRAIENSGMVLPMLRQLGIDIDFKENNVSIGIEKDIVRLSSRESLQEYKELILNKFPDNKDDVEKIVEEIEKIMGYMDVLYGIDNPIFVDLKKDKKYLYKTILPWMVKYITTISKIVKLDIPVYEYLRKFTSNEALIDMIGQHFFQNTPTFFALSYFGLYLDYRYPKGGTGALVDSIEGFILQNGGEIKKETEIITVDCRDKIIKSSSGNIYKYKKIIWAADLKQLYNSVDLNSLNNLKEKEKVEKVKCSLEPLKGGDSILSVYLTVDKDIRYFEDICTEHFFYTPSKDGLNSINIYDMPITSSEKDDTLNWLKEYYKLTTYEISIPAMRDKNLAPVGKTGLIISTLIDYSIVKDICEQGWYDEFKEISAQCIIEVLSNSIFEALDNYIIDKFVATPMTIKRITGNSDGAITGWAFTNDSIPVVNKMTKVAKSVDTVIPDVYQAGQWTFSPSGLPISILTGKLAADKVIKNIRH